MQFLLHMTGIQLMLHETPCEFDNTCSGPYPAQWNKSTDHMLGCYGTMKLLQEFLNAYFLFLHLDYTLNRTALDSRPQLMWVTL